jgi:hypothetical protein
MSINHRRHHYLANMDFGHWLTRFGLTRLELGNLLRGILFIFCNRFLLYSCIFPKLGLYLILLQSLC